MNNKSNEVPRAILARDRSLRLPQHGEQVTLAQIAAQAGVATSTVSRALNPKGDGVSHSTALRIRSLAAELGYQPHAAAAGLRTRRSGVIGVLVPRLTDPVVATVYEGIEKEAAALGYFTFVANTNDDPDLQRIRLARFGERRVEGLILADARLDSTLARDLNQQRIPFILVSRTLPGAISVTCDDRYGGRIAATHLLEQGHKTAGVVAGEQYASTGMNRTLGFVRGFALAGHPIPLDYIIPGPFDVEAGRRAGERLLALRPRPTAIFASNDFNAIGVLSALRDAGLKAGEDVAVVGFNDSPIAAHLPIPLTSVRSPMLEMGRIAARFMTQILAGEQVRSKRLRPKLIPRQSSTLWRPAPDGLNRRCV